MRNRVVVDAYLKDSATEADRAEAQRELEGTAGVKSVEYISKDEALRELGHKVTDTQDKIELLGSNPLPSLFRVTPDDPDELKAIVAQIAPGGQPRLDAIDDVQNRESDTGKILSATGLVKGLGAVMAGLLDPRLDRAGREHDPAVGVRAPARGRGDEAGRRHQLVHPLAVRDRRRDRRLPGRHPGGAAAGDRQDDGRRPLSDRFALLAAPDTIDFPLLIVLLLFACVAVSAIGSGITLRRFLRV